MQCQICGEPALKGARLCAPCKKALKRARHDTVSVVQPLLDRATGTLERRKLQRAAKLDPQGPISVIPPPLAVSRVRSPVVFAWIALPLCVVAYFAVHRLGATSGIDMTQGQPAAPPTVAAVIEPSLPPSAEPRPAAAPVDEPAKLPRPPRAAAPVAPPPAVAAAVPASLSSPVAAEVAPPEPALARPAASVPAPPDRGQLINAMFERCSGNVFEKAVCEQRARLEHCEGYWGALPQCPAARDSYGQ